MDNEVTRAHDLYAFAWFSPAGQLWAIFRSHENGIGFLEHLTKTYSSRTYAAQMGLEDWHRHGISPFVEWEVQ